MAIRDRGKELDMNVLMLSHYFPPMNLIGSKRMESLAKQIVEEGHKLTVLKAADIYYGENIDSNYKWNECEIINVVPKQDIWYEWIRAYDHRAYKAANKRNYDVCVISGGPFNYFLTGSRTLRKLNIPYVLDFRDVAAPFQSAPGYSCKVSKVKSILSFLKNYYIEYRSIKYSKYAVMTSESMRNMYTERFPRFKDKFTVIYNGYDGKLLQNFCKRSFNTRKLSIGIFGKYSYYGKEYADWFSTAVRNIQRKGIEVEILHIGEKETWLEEYLSGNKCYKNVGTLDYPIGMELLSGQWVMVVSHYMREAISTKIFDYIFLNHPVIGVFEKNSASALLLSKFENGFVVHSEAEMERSLLSIWEEKITTLMKNTDRTSGYSRDVQNRKYIKLLSEISNHV